MKTTRRVTTSCCQSGNPSQVTSGQKNRASCSRQQLTMLAVGLTAMLLLFLLTDLGVTGWAQPALLLRDVCQDDGRVDTLLVIRPVWHTSTNVAVSLSSSFPAHQVSPSASFLGQQHTACAPCMLPLAPPPQRHTHDPPPHVPLTTQHASATSPHKQCLTSTLLLLGLRMWVESSPLTCCRPRHTAPGRCHQCCGGPCRWRRRRA